MEKRRLCSTDLTYVTSILYKTDSQPPQNMKKTKLNVSKRFQLYQKVFAFSTSLVWPKPIQYRKS